MKRICCLQLIRAGYQRCQKSFYSTSQASSHNDLSIQDSYQYHVPVMCNELIQSLKPQPGKVYVDMTFGAGGHSSALLSYCPDIQIIALDRDTTTFKHVLPLQEKYGKDKIHHYRGKFTDLPELLEEDGRERHQFVDGVLFDLGASTMQYEDRKRGFSLKYNGALDMRMNKNEETPTAADILNNLDEKSIHQILKKYGEEKKAKQIARLVVEQRQGLGPILTTRDLQDLVRNVYETEGQNLPRDKLNRERHPATLTFQALRIFVNDELNQLYNGLKVAHRLLKPDGVCAVMSFHSLEHRIVHQVFNAQVMKDRETEVTPDLIDSRHLYMWYSDRRAIKPTQTEIESNPKARSAEITVARKVAVYK